MQLLLFNNSVIFNLPLTQNRQLTHALGQFLFYRCVRTVTHHLHNSRRVDYFLPFLPFLVLEPEPHFAIITPPYYTIRHDYRYIDLN